MCNKYISVIIDPEVSFSESIINCSEDAIITKRIDGVILSWNRAAEEIFGYAPGEIIGQHFSLIFPLRSIDHETLVIEKVKNGERVPNYEIDCTMKNGTTLALSISASPLKNALNDTVGIVQIMRPFTQYVHIRESLQQSMKEIADYKYALDESSIVAITDTKGTIKYVNDNFCKISKFSKEELIGQDHRIINSGTHDAAFIKDLWVTIANGKIWKGEIRNRAKDGSFYWVDTTIVPFLNEKGRPYQYVAIRSDITERKLKTEQINDLLENINDGFIALDKDMRYAYANKRIGLMLGTSPESLIGKYVWDIFKDAIGSPTYQAIQMAHKEGIHITNEDYYPPLSLWQENRIYPSNGGLSIFIRDITKRKQEEQHLKLLESVITNATDAILITDANLIDGIGPRIVYINSAFTKMTGYTADDVIGKTPRMMQGYKTDRQELDRLRDALEKQVPCEITTINYKKNGEEFWINFSVNPVINEQCECTHFIAVERDVTQSKNKELQKSLISGVSKIFNNNASLNDILTKTAEQLVAYGKFEIAEFWLCDPDKKNIVLSAQYSSTERSATFTAQNSHINSFLKGHGLPGMTWETQAVQYWDTIADGGLFSRAEAAKSAGLTVVCSIPLVYNNNTIGAILIGSGSDRAVVSQFTTLFDELSTHLAAEIVRKQLELELNQIFNFSPDVICISGTDGYLKKINPAMCALLEYTEQELLSTPFDDFVYPGDRAIIASKKEILGTEASTVNYESRFVTRSGKIRWLAWTATVLPKERVIFNVAKDITDKKELEVLLNKATDLARIGSWEIDMIKGTVYWSKITKEIHGVGPEYMPDQVSAASFIKEGADRDIVTKLITDTIHNGAPFDVEIQIVVAAENTKWVRVIGEAEYANNKCTRVYGSFQDIDVRKKAEIAVTEVLEERNTILESIGDAFFAIDRNWTVTYWNNTAQKVLNVPKDKIIGRNLWDVFSGSVGSLSHMQYSLAMKSNKAIHFEDYYDVIDRWYEISAYPADNGLSVYFKDITERKSGEIRMREMNERLVKHAKALAISNAELEQFAYVASHDLQEPLRMVTSFLTQLEKKYGEIIDEKGKKYIYFAVDGAKRMRQIILDLLEFSRVGRTDDDLEEVDINLLVEDISILFRKQIEETKAVIKFTDLPVVRTFKSPIRQVFQNLIGNSLKYHKQSEAPHIFISCEETDAQWLFSVKDNGIGIDPEYYDKIFIIFQRLHNKDEYSGTGMGLAVTKKIVENLGGTIWLSSEEGKGSTFYFTLLKGSQ